MNVISMLKDNTLSQMLGFSLGHSPMCIDKPNLLGTVLIA